MRERILAFLDNTWLARLGAVQALITLALLLAGVAGVGVVDEAVKTLTDADSEGR